jgi:hypothetical protein
MPPTAGRLPGAAGALARDADLFLLSLFAGMYSVPMYALIQLRSPATHRARIIAANNILNALFMIVSALWAPARCWRGPERARRCSW